MISLSVLVTFLLNDVWLLGVIGEELSHKSVYVDFLDAFYRYRHNLRGLNDCTSEESSFGE